MFPCCDDFSASIDGLIQHLKFEEETLVFFHQLSRMCNDDSDISSLVRTHLDEVVKPSKISSKEFTYKHSIVSLYGYLENFIEKLSDEFATKINDALLPVKALPESIRNNHLEISMRYLTKVLRNSNHQNNDKREREKEVVSNLNSFLQETEGYKLNSEAYAVHSANFRYQLIQSHFSQLGVNHIADRALGFENVVNLLAIRQQQEATTEKSILTGWLEFELAQLAQLRNEIAHGAFEGSIETIELIIERAEFIKEFGLALAIILHRSFDAILFKGRNRAVIGKPDQVFPKLGCLGFKGVALQNDEIKNTVKVGDEVFAANSGSVVSGIVKSLNLDMQIVDKVEFPNERDFSMKVDFEVSNSMTNREISISKF
ncbi:hypothetical protein Maes01_02325 [Microbulbifer aestuariivivens]|uniref:RiboL-PSP-HEPN domain-containing protein n=1 Tax=Microbulbifer aestuariivivens TaxID=1908308 RepID=A0ABP9WRC2_9GAMM